MRIRHLRVERFRGIKLLDWIPASKVACVIGAGDSTKTTILDAIELALSSRWSVSVSDSDFYCGKLDEPLRITVTVGELPVGFLNEEKFGLDLRGWSDLEGLHDEPLDADEKVITIQFSVDDSLEPSWVIVNDRRTEGKHISARDREALGLVRLGGDVDRHLSWGRGSALTRATDDLSEVNRAVADAQREARQAVAQAPLLKLKGAASKAQEAATQMGMRVTAQYRPGLEPSAVTVGVGQLSLHQGDIPLRSAGLGSRRLNALALQRLAVTEGSLLLVDEVEYGLEPHRLRHLLRELQSAAGSRGQVVMTTHSTVPIEELSAASLYVARSDDGTTTICHVDGSLQALVRRNPEALLGRKILVCEGKTEVGLCRGMFAAWASSNNGLPFVHTGTALGDGGGADSANTAVGVAGLGYRTSLLADSDAALEPSPEQLAAAGVDSFLWPGGVCTELRVALDLPIGLLQKFVDLGVSHVGEQSVVAVVRAQLSNDARLQGVIVDDWLRAGIAVADVRSALGRAADDKKWFKSVSRGEALGQLVAEALPQIPSTPLAQTLTLVSQWTYAA